MRLEKNRKLLGFRHLWRRPGLQQKMDLYRDSSATTFLAETIVIGHDLLGL